MVAVSRSDEGRACKQAVADHPAAAGPSRPSGPRSIDIPGRDSDGRVLSNFWCAFATAGASNCHKRAVWPSPMRVDRGDLTVEHRSFEEFYMSEYRSVLAFARAFTGDRPLAEDVVHDAFERAFERWGTLSNPSAWVRQVTANNARAAWRRSQAEQRAVSRLDASDVAYSDLPVETEEFWSVVRSLPANQAKSVVLFYLEDRPVSEIAEILGCRESTARGHLSKGRRNLAKRLGVWR